MGPLRDAFARNGVAGGVAYVEALWTSRHSGRALSGPDAEDATWLVQHTAADANLQLQLWPKLLGLLTRWAFLQARGGTVAPDAQGAMASLAQLQQWLAAFLGSHAVSWPALAPALLLLAVTSSLTIGAGGPDPKQATTLARQAVLGALAPQQAPTPASDPRSSPVLASSPDRGMLLRFPNAVTDLCAAAELLLERLAFDGDSQDVAGLLAALIASLGGAVASLASAVAAAAGGAARAPAGSAAPAAAAAAREAAAVALAALHAACRQLGAACARAAAAAAGPNGSRTPALAGAGRPVTAPAAGPPAAAALALAAERMRADAAAAAMPANVLHAPQGPHASVSQSPTSHVPADPRVIQAFSAVAACGLLEGCTAAARLQPPQLQPGLLSALHPALAALAGTARDAAAAAAAATAVTAAPTAGPAAQLAEQVADPGGLLRMAVGYCWARLRVQAPLQGHGQAVSGPAVAEGLAAAAAATAASQGCGAWHPALGSLDMLLGGSLGVARLLEMGPAGASVEAAVELMESHTQGPLFADTQPLARAVLEAIRTPAGPPPQPLAAQLLQETAAATRRLHQLYGSVADSVGGRAWLAALPLAATGALRDVLDRIFVCAVSVLAVSYDVLAPAVPLTAAPVLPTEQAEAARTAEAAATLAVTALGALGDLQFCALQLRAYGDLVARLNAAIAAAPAAAPPLLISLLPCYPALEAAYGGGAPAVAVSRLAFLLPVAASCLPHAEHLDAAAAAVLPFVYLLLKGAPEAVTQAAHSVWVALLDRLCETEAEPPKQPAAAAAAAAAAAPPALAGRRGGVELAASMVPYYLERSAQAPVGPGDVELMERGLRQVIKSLPASHPMKAWCVQRLAQQLAAWIQAPPPPVPTPPPPAPSPLPPAASTANQPPTLQQRCAVCLATLAAELDFPLLPHALDAFSDLLSSLDAAGRTIVLQQLYEAWAQCNDYARKPLLDDWLRRWLAAPVPMGDGGVGAGRGAGAGAGRMERLRVQLL